MRKRMQNASFLAALIFILAVNAVNAQQVQVKPVPGAKLVSLERLIPTATSQKIFFTAAVDPDCTPQNVPTLRTLLRPQHGTVDIADSEDYAYWQPPNIREKCNDKKIKGLRISYKSDEGYTGDDKVIILAIYPDSTAQQYVFDIHVW